MYNWIAFMSLEVEHASYVGWIGSISVLLIIGYWCLCVTVGLQPLSGRCNFTLVFIR